MSSDLRSRTVWRNFLSCFVDVCCITGSEIKRPCSHVARDPSFFFGLQACLPLLSVLKQLKYFWNLPQSHVAILLERLAEQLMPEHAAPFQSLQHDLAQEQDCVVAIKDPCCPCGYIVKNCLFSTNGSQ